MRGTLPNAPVLRSARWIPRYRLPIILVAAVIFAGALPGLFRLDVTVEISKFFLAEDPVTKNRTEFRRLFGNNDFVGVLVESDDVFSVETLELIKKVGDALREQVPLAGNLVSLAELTRARSGGPPLVFEEGRLVSTPTQVEAIREALSANSSMAGVLFSTDFRQAWILLGLQEYPPTQRWSENTTPLFTVGRIAAETVGSIDPGSARLIATGAPVYAFRKEAEMMSDLRRVLMFGAAVALILAIAILRSGRGVAGTLGIILFSVVTVLGIQGWMGVSTDSAFIAVPVLLIMGVSIGYAVHVFRFFSRRYQSSGRRDESAVYAVTETGRPILFTAFTTIVALISFLFVDIRPIRWVGITSAFGILAVFLSSTILFPAILSLGSARRRQKKNVSTPAVFESLLDKFATVVLRFEIPIIILFLAVVAASVFGIARLQIDFDAEKMMGTRLPHMQEQSVVSSSSIAANDALEFVVVASPGEFRNPDTVLILERLALEIEAMDGVKKTQSVAGILRETNYLLHGRNPDYDVLPESLPSLGALYTLAENLAPEELRKWTDEGYSHARVLIEITDFSSRDIEALVERVTEKTDQLFPAAAGHFMSGSTYEMAVMNQYVTRGLVRSVITALATITVLMMLVFRSVSLGLAAMVPNVFPVLVAGGIMGFARIPLEFVTMTVAPLIMGLSVDDTIHLVSRMKRERKRAPDFETVLRRSFFHVGTAITETTVILCLSFLVFTVSRVNSIVYMGLLSSVGMFSAYVADVFVTPVIIRRL